MKIQFAGLTGTEQEAALATFSTDIKGLDDAALAAALTDVNTQASTLFALDAPTVAQADEASALVAAKGAITTLQTERAAEVKAAADKFAAAKAAFADESDETEAEAEGDEETEAEGDEAEAEETEDEPEGDEVVEAAKGENPFEKDPKKKKKGSEDDDEEKKAMTASAGRTFPNPKGGVAGKVAGKSPRPAKAAVAPMTITAAADVPGVATGSRLPDMDAVAKALISRVGAFPAHNEFAAQKINEETGGLPRISKYGVASFGLQTKSGLKRDSGPEAEYRAMQDAVKEHGDALAAAMAADSTLLAAGWCAPSTIGYTWLANYVVDGLLSMPETDAPRGGLMTTTGPALADEYNQNGSDFGFVQTEAQAEARTPKTFETLVCPDFIDHRLDAMGYGWKIPFLTEDAYPELVKDALRLSSVLYAHKQNTRFINDIVAGSTPISAVGLGASLTDTLEALCIVAVKERRKWNVGENAIMEVKLPVWVKEVFRADMSRRTNVTVENITDEQINAQFTSRRLAVEYISDFLELTGDAPVFATTFKAIMYPAGTWVRVVRDVINLTAIHDAASLTVNEYTGIFMEQGIMTFKAGYRSHVITFQTNAAGLTGAPVLDNHTSTGNYAGAGTGA